MREKVSDLWILVRHDKRTQIICAAGVAFGLFLVLSPGRHERRARVESASLPSVVNGMESRNDLLEAFRAELDSAKKNREIDAGELAIIKNQLDESEASQVRIFNRIIDLVTESRNTSAQEGPQALPEEAIPTTGEIIESFGNRAADEVIPPVMPSRREAVVSIGNSLRIRFLTGVIASTDGIPYPALAEATGSIEGPNGTALPVGNARILLACQGSLIDARALCRMVKMNLVIPGGETVDVAVDGWVVGEDGVRGMQGLLHDPIGRAVLTGAEAGALEGFGEGIAQGDSLVVSGVYGTTTATNEADPLLQGAGRALQGGSRQVIEFLNTRKELLEPAIEVYSGREATAIFTATVAIPGLYRALQDNDFDSKI